MGDMVNIHGGDMGDTGDMVDIHGGDIGNTGDMGGTGDRLATVVYYRKT